MPPPPSIPSRFKDPGTRRIRNPRYPSWGRGGNGDRYWGRGACPRPHGDPLPFLIGSESIVVTTVQIGNVGRNIYPRGNLPPPPITTGWPPYGLSPSYTLPLSGFAPSVHFESERHDAKENHEGFENMFQNENNILNRENPHIVPRGQDADELLNVHIPDLAHLAEKVRQVELMKKEKEKHRNEQKLKSKPFTRKEKVAYVTMESSEEELDLKTEIDLAELKKGLPYQKIKDRDVSLCPRCNTVFDAEAATIFKKERMKKELAYRKEQAHQRQPI
ncbi:hypothetical protein Ahy_A06g026625 [Arachis hypogaea]|uniref:Uncharacterized protein n=1 Tax=Arachis hypogaea TaxID=3818 RepID=A0A445CL37_ARAHY|nr:hypothetical protein Ahy_A06g026625 [Arachis hypogaea]